MWQCQSLSSFFGLVSSYKLVLHNQIFEIIFYSKGGFTFSEVYNLPIFLRNYYHKRLVKEYEQMNKETKKEMSKIKSNPNTKK